MAIAANKKRKSGRPARAKARAATGAEPVRRGRRATAGRAADEPERAAPPLAEVDADVLEFIEAIDRFKKKHARPFPSWSEVLMVLKQLGYRRG